VLAGKRAIHVPGVNLLPTYTPSSFTTSMPLCTALPHTLPVATSASIASPGAVRMPLLPPWFLRLRCACIFQPPVKTTSCPVRRRVLQQHCWLRQATLPLHRHLPYLPRKAPALLAACYYTDASAARSREGNGGSARLRVLYATMPRRLPPSWSTSTLQQARSLLRLGLIACMADSMAHTAFSSPNTKERLLPTSARTPDTTTAYLHRQPSPCPACA